MVALLALPILAGCAPGEAGYKDREAASGNADPSAVSSELSAGKAGPATDEAAGGSAEEPAEGESSPEETGKEAPKGSDEGAGG
jgi:hypothetical protein